jgi:hypothetical protein
LKNLNLLSRFAFDLGPRNILEAMSLRGNGATVACIWILYNIFAMLKWNNVIFPRYVDT